MTENFPRRNKPLGFSARYSNISSTSALVSTIDFFQAKKKNIRIPKVITPLSLRAGQSDKSGSSSGGWK